MQAGNETTNSRALAVADRSAPRLLRYACAGAAGTAAHYAVLFALLDALGSPVEASTTGAVVGALVNFWLARRWVFAGRRSIRMPLPKFAVVAAAALGVNAAILSLLVLSLPVLPSQLVATGCAFLAGYVLNDAWSFRERTSR